MHLIFSSGVVYVQGSSINVEVDDPKDDPEPQGEDIECLIDLYLFKGYPLKHS